MKLLRFQPANTAPKDGRVIHAILAGNGREHHLERVIWNSAAKAWALVDQPNRGYPSDNVRYWAPDTDLSKEELVASAEACFAIAGERYDRVFKRMGLT